MRVEDGRVVELDGRAEASFDMLDRFIARHAIDIGVAPDAMAMDSLTIARMMVDITTPRSEVIRIIGGLSPAKVMDVVNRLNVVEMMMALQKMRARRTPFNQAHVTNKKENPALLAADAAEAVERGFAELETTVGVSRYAPFNAMAILIGSQTGRGTALTQCAVEESLGLRMAWLGLTTYAETLSVYGTEQAFRDGDEAGAIRPRQPGDRVVAEGAPLARRSARGCGRGFGGLRLVHQQRRATVKPQADVAPRGRVARQGNAHRFAPSGAHQERMHGFGAFSGQGRHPIEAASNEPVR